MSNIWVPQGNMKGRNKAAFRGNLNCPVCRSTAVRFVENVGPYRLRYRCRKCGMPFQYETGRDMAIHPYAVLNKPRFNNFAEVHSKVVENRGRIKKGGSK